MTIAERVEAGAAWLDQVWPEWFTRIDLAALDLELPCNCVLGQCFATDEQPAGFVVVCALMDRAAGDEVTHDWLDDHGFLASGEVSPSIEYGLLDELWVDAVKARYNQGAEL